MQESGNKKPKIFKAVLALFLILLLSALSFGYLYAQRERQNAMPLLQMSTAISMPTQPFSA